MQEYEQYFREPPEIDPIPANPTFHLRDIPFLRAVECRTDKGGFSFHTIPWVPNAHNHDGGEVFARRISTIGDLEEPMDRGWFIIGGAERPGREAEVGVVERNKPLLYRPVQIVSIDKAISEGLVASDEGRSYLKEQGLVRSIEGGEVFLRADELCATGLVRQVRLLDKKPSSEQQEPKRLI